MAWPIRTGPLRAPRGPRVVGVAETVAAVVVCLAPARVGAIAATVAYLALALAAWRYRGRPCGCFGTAKLAALTTTHAVLNTAAAGVAAALVLTAAGRLPVPQPVAVATVTALVTLALVANGGRRPAPAKPCHAPIGGVRVYVTDACPACTALLQLLRTIEPARRDRVIIERLTEDSPGPDPERRRQVPSAVPLSAGGQPVCDEAIGLPAVHDVITRITIPAGTSPAP